MQDTLQEVFQLDAALQQDLVTFTIQVLIFALLVMGSWIFARLLPGFLNAGIRRFTPRTFSHSYRRVADPLRRAMVHTVCLGLIALSLGQLQDYPGLYNVLHFFVYLAFALSAGWLASRLVHELLRLYGIKLVQQFTQEVDDFVMVLGNLANAVIVFFTIVYFAQTQNLNLISVVAGLGVVGLAISFAARETFAQIIGSIVLYLDRPYVPGEYIRVNFNPKDEDVYGRVEAIGIRSTKIRVVAKNTLVIAPNSAMVKKDIENISRGTKVMALLYLDFTQVLRDSERALVKDLLIKTIGGIGGVESLSIRIFLFEPDDKPGTRARVSFFLLGSSQGAINIRKRLVEVANKKITASLREHGLEFTIQDPMLYVDAPVTR